MAKIVNLLSLIWAEQKAYNVKVRSTLAGLGYEAWMEKYLLGVISEMNEVLNEINWKAHRRGKPIDRVNLARELADLTKYTFSLWDWSGFTEEDMLHYVHQKSLELERQWAQDFELVYPPGCPIVITDIDGTLADYRQGFISWLKEVHREELPADKATTLALEVDLGLPYSKYVAYKEEFEANGGYSNLPMYLEVAEALEDLCDGGIYFIAYTARPAQSYSRIWNDTWSWVLDNKLDPYLKEIRIGKEQRIARACDLMEQGHKVVLIDDEPDTALRAAAAGLTVFLRDQPYNVGCDHYNIIRFNTLPTILIQAYLEKK